MGRTENSVKNIVTGIGGQIISLVAQFMCRTVFVYALDKEYLGINGLFSNILTLLSLAELGFGTALIYSMYKPIAENDKSAICKLMNLYRYIYIVVAGVILVVGLSLTPFLNFFISGNTAVSNLKLIYILYLLNTVSGYLLIYKKSIIDAHQKAYIATIYQKLGLIVQNVLQIVILLLTHNFLAYLMCQICVNIGINISISMKATRMFPYLAVDKKSIPDKETCTLIAKNTFAMSLHKIGGVLVEATDNLIMSAYVGLGAVGIYSNYTLIANNIRSCLVVVFNSFTASVGNLIAVENREKAHEIFRTLTFACFVLTGGCAVAMYELFNPFIRAWIGEDYLFGTPIVAIVVLNFYIYCMRRVPLIFRDAMGLFWYDRYKSLAEAFMNLLVSIILAQKIGILGVLIGTTVSSLTTCVWIEPLILYKYGFKRSVLEYFKENVIYLSTIVGVIALIDFICIRICIDGFAGVIVKSGISAICYLIVICLTYGRTKQFSTLKGYVEGLLPRLSTPKKN